ncbi:MAG: endonuclease III [Simkaniaceae bacterium]|nr:endonuclease III [Simkaniaceae bacterium]
MNRKQRATIILKILESLFPKTPIPLTHKDHYTLLIAVLLSAQCTDKRVNMITPTLFLLASTPNDMAKQKVEDIEKIIRPCGLSNFKANAIKNLSIDLLRDHQGKVPNDINDLEKLPGVGHKTASVVVSQCFNIPAFPVDTHIHRCAKRWGLSSGKNVKETERDLKMLFPEKLWNKLHLQIIYYARQYCQARGHKIELCPICTELNLTRYNTTNFN